MYFTQIYPFRENARYKTDVFFLLFLGLFAVGSFLIVTLVLEGERRRYYLPVIILYIYVDYLLIGTVRRVIYLEKIVENDYENVEPRKNPFIQLERFKKQDLKLQNWLNFSLGAARKDKRKRKQLFLKNYFSNFKNDWSTILNGRGINLNIDNI